MSWSDTAATIYASAIAGNSVNPGLPPNMANFLVGQAGFETGEGTSNFFLNNNNCFGYSCDSSSSWQDGCSTGNADNGAQVGNYDSIDDSVQELVDYWWRRASDGKGGCPSDLTTITDATTYADILSGAGYYTSSSAAYAAGITADLSAAGNFFRKR
jgi:hypothetical protein